MNGKVLVMCPCRDRNVRLFRMIHSVLETSTMADVAVYIDDDQEQDFPLDGFPPRSYRLVGPRIGPCDSFNRLFRAFPGYEAYGAATDDCLFLTPGWDRWVLARATEFPGGIGVMSPKNRDSKRMDFPWATPRWIEVLGWLAHPECWHFYWDVVMEVLADEAGVLVMATESEFEMVHEDVKTSDVNLKIRHDSWAALHVLAFDRRDLVAKIKSAIATESLVEPAGKTL